MFPLPITDWVATSASGNYRSSSSASCHLPSEALEPLAIKQSSHTWSSCSTVRLLSLSITHLSRVHLILVLHNHSLRFMNLEIWSYGLPHLLCVETKLNTLAYRIEVFSWNWVVVRVTLVCICPFDICLELWTALRQRCDETLGWPTS